MRLATKRCESLGACPSGSLFGATSGTLAQQRKTFNSGETHFPTLKGHKMAQERTSRLAPAFFRGLTAPSAEAQLPDRFRQPRHRTSGYLP
jgi:hypothetical protein